MGCYLERMDNEEKVRLLRRCRERLDDLNWCWLSMRCLIQKTELKRNKNKDHNYQGSCKRNTPFNGRKKIEEIFSLYILLRVLLIN